MARFSLFLPMFLETFFVPIISKNLDDILVWNKKVNEYVVGVFDFAHMLLAFDGAILLFHPNDLKVLKEVKSYLENCGF
jgi:hypothetical protein